jgi:hypothetical protein
MGFLRNRGCIFAIDNHRNGPGYRPRKETALDLAQRAFASVQPLARALSLGWLWAIAWIQNRFMDTQFLRAAFQVVLGGSLVFAVGILIGAA